MYILLFFFILLFIIININLTIYINLSRINNKNTIYFCIKIYNIEIITIQIPFLNINIDGKENIYFNFKHNIKIRKQSIRNKDRNLDLNYIINSLKNITNKRAYYIFFTSIYKKIIIKDLILNTSIGCTDAHIIAVLYGILHILKSNIIYYLNYKVNIINYNYFVNTIYNRNIFEFNYKIIFKIKIIYIIKSLLTLLFNLKDGEKNG